MFRINMTSNAYGHATAPFGGSPEVSFHLLRARGRQLLGHHPTSHTLPIT